MTGVKDTIKELRERTRMNRREFCDYFGVLYTAKKLDGGSYGNK